MANYQAVDRLLAIANLTRISVWRFPIENAHWKQLQNMIEKVSCIKWKSTNCLANKHKYKIELKAICAVLFSLNKYLCPPNSDRIAFLYPFSQCVQTKLNYVLDENCFLFHRRHFTMHTKNLQRRWLSKSMW